MTDLLSDDAIAALADVVALDAREDVALVVAIEGDAYSFQVVPRVDLVAHLVACGDDLAPPFDHIAAGPAGRGRFWIAVGRGSYVVTARVRVTPMSPGGAA